MLCTPMEPLSKSREYDKQTLPPRQQLAEEEAAALGCCEPRPTARQRQSDWAVAPQLPYVEGCACTDPYARTYAKENICV